MNYLKLAQSIPVGKRKNAMDKLADIILSSKKEDKMPSDLANIMLSQWQQDQLVTELGLSTLLKASILLEQEKTLTALEELQLSEIAEKLKGEV